MTKLLPPDTSLKALAKLAGPIWIANIAIVGSGTIDTIMAGHLGKEHLAAIALGIATTISVLMGLVGVLMGLSPIAGHHFGARKFRAIGEELNQSFWLSLVLMAVGVPLLLNTDFWIELGGAKGEVAEMAAEFIRWTAFALPASLLGRCFIALNAAVSRPRITMWVSLGMLALKAPLNAVFMYGWLGFPAMGGGGAGISFFVLSWLSLFAFLAIWKFDKFYRPMHVEKFVGPRWELLKNHLHVGVPMGLSTFFEVSSFTLMAIFISRLGEETVSAHQIVANLTSMLYMVPLSLGIASSVLISQSLGARWPAVAEFILRRTLKISIVIAAVLATLLYIFKGNVIALYTSDAGVAATAAALVAFGCTYHVFDAMQAVSSFALRGYRVTRAPMFIYGIMLWGRGDRDRVSARLRRRMGGRSVRRLRLLGAPRPWASSSRVFRFSPWPSGWGGSARATNTIRPKRSNASFERRGPDVRTFRMQPVRSAAPAFFMKERV